MDREGKAVGAEALVRWIHPEEGLRPPNAFIPVFEKNGMIAEVDRFIWRKSCEILARWKQEGKDLFISVNISPKDFYLLDVSGELKRLVREYGVEPAALRLEITESMMMGDTEKQMEILKALREAGFCIEMDDFGSGYSSLNLLREMPVDVLKIDMVFLRQAGQNPRARTIIRQVIAMARELRITSLTEGVETKAQYEGLWEMGCELYQGYYFAKPMPEEDFERFLSGSDAE
jgi:EAL domain-containing protein (putative c-di-GMP-specific phosphodiesterase class I)